MQSAWRSQPLRTKAKPQNTNSSYVLETKSSKRNPQNGVCKFRCKTQTARWDLYQTLSCYDPILVPNSRRRTVTKVRRLRHGLRTLVSARICVGNGCLGIWAPERATSYSSSSNQQRPACFHRLTPDSFWDSSVEYRILAQPHHEHSFRPIG